MVVLPGLSFDQSAQAVSRAVGRPSAFLVSAVIIALAVAAALNPAWRDTVNLWGGALTGYVSILLLVLLQGSTNREAAAMMLKLDTIVAALDKAPNEVVAVEARSIQEIDVMRKALQRQVKGDAPSPWGPNRFP